MNYHLTDGNREAQHQLEHNDCVVRAFATALDIPYYKAHEVCKLYGRKDRHRTKGYVVCDVLEHFGLQKTRTKIVPRDMPTLHQFIKDHPTGVYILHKKGHLFTLKNGVVYDSWRVGKKSKINWYAEVKNPLTNTKSQGSLS